MAQDVLITLQQDLERALRRPDKTRRWVMVIDLRKTISKKQLPERQDKKY